MPKPDADPHGGLEAFNEVVEDPICGLKSDSRPGYADEMH